MFANLQIPWKVEWTRVCLFHRLPYPQIARLLTEPPLRKVEPSSHAGSKFLLNPSPHVAPLEQHVCLCVEGDLLGCFNGKPKEETTIWAGPLFRYPHPITPGLSSSILSHFRRRKVRFPWRVSFGPCWFSALMLRFPLRESPKAVHSTTVALAKRGRQSREDVDFQIPRGGSLALVGTTGAGKTTVTRRVQRGLFRVASSSWAGVSLHTDETF